MVAAVLGPRCGPDPSGVFVSIPQFCAFHVWIWILGSPQKIGDGLLHCDGFSNIVRLAGLCLQVQVCLLFISKLTLFECLKSNTVHLTLGTSGGSKKVKLAVEYCLFDIRLTAFNVAIDKSATIV